MKSTNRRLTLYRLTIIFFILFLTVTIHAFDGMPIFLYKDIVYVPFEEMTRNLSSIPKYNSNLFENKKLSNDGTTYVGNTFIRTYQCGGHTYTITGNINKNYKRCLLNQLLPISRKMVDGSIYQTLKIKIDGKLLIIPSPGIIIVEVTTKGYPENLLMVPAHCFKDRFNLKLICDSKY